MDDELLGILGLVMYGDDPWQIGSRTKLHCLALYLQERTNGVDYGFSGTASGPRSDAVDTLLNSAIDQDFIVEKERVTFGGEKRYSYALTENGASVVEANRDVLVVAESKAVMQEEERPVSNLMIDVVEDFPRFRAEAGW